MVRPRMTPQNNPKYALTRQLYQYIAASVRDQTYTPTVAEMGQALHMSESGIRRHLDRLEAWGWISREPGKRRAIRLLRTAEPGETDRRSIPHDSR
jgi:SOS-response transcriptional repressor LexA